MKKFCDFFCNHRNLGLLVVGASAFALAFAYTSQFMFDKFPCHLCLEERKPYMAVIGLGLLAVALAKKKPRFTFILLLLCGVAFAIDTGIAGFHVGVEKQWWTMPASCENVPDPDMTLEELREYMQNRPVVNCGAPTWIIPNILSMAAMNFLYALGLTVFTLFHSIKGYRDARKNKTQA